MKKNIQSTVLKRILQTDKLHRVSSHQGLLKSHTASTTSRFASKLSLKYPHSPERKALEGEGFLNHKSQNNLKTPQNDLPSIHSTAALDHSCSLLTKSAEKAINCAYSTRVCGLKPCESTYGSTIVCNSRFFSETPENIKISFQAQNKGPKKYHVSIIFKLLWQAIADELSSLNIIIGRKKYLITFLIAKSLGNQSSLNSYFLLNFR